MAGLGGGREQARRHVDESPDGCKLLGRIVAFGLGHRDDTHRVECEAKCHPYIVAPTTISHRPYLPLGTRVGSVVCERSHGTHLHIREAGCEYVLCVPQADGTKQMTPERYREIFENPGSLPVTGVPEWLVLEAGWAVYYSWVAPHPPAYLLWTSNTTTMDSLMKRVPLNRQPSPVEPFSASFDGVGSLSYDQLMSRDSLDANVFDASGEQLWIQVILGSAATIYYFPRDSDRLKNPTPVAIRWMLPENATPKQG
jgi:hypothetical protein